MAIAPSTFPPLRLFVEAAKELAVRVVK